ncbi:MAG TPA: hypothetical protein VI259_24105 [Gemmatimonadaceae bacterium]
MRIHRSLIHITGALAITISQGVVGAQTRVTPTRISTVAPTWLSRPSESPDGRFVALDGDSAIRVFDRTTKQWMRLAEEGATPKWSPDGHFLAFSRREPVGFRIFLLPMDSKTGKASGAARRVTLRNGRQFAWSPNGKEIAFISMDSGAASIWIQPFNGGEERLAARLPRLVGDALAWSPDGKLIYFSAGPPPGRGHPGFVGRVTLATGRVDSLRPVRDFIGVSADGRYLAQAASNTIIISSASDGREVTRVYLPPSMRATSWSTRTPNELLGTENPIYQEVHSISLADGAIRKLAAGDSLTAGGVQLTSDGSQLLYTVGTRITISRPDGSNARVLRTAADVAPRSAKWSPDGSRIAYMTTEPGEIRVVDVRTGNDVRVAQLHDTFPLAGSMIDFVWRRDGRAVRYSKLSLSGFAASYALHEASLTGHDSVIATIPDSLAAPYAHFLNDSTFARQYAQGVAALNLNSGKWTVLLPKGGSDPVFSADGSMLVYENYPVANRDDAVLQVVEGGRTRTIANPFGGEVNQIAILPDKRNVLAAVCASCVNGIERRSLVLFPLNGDPPRVLSEKEGPMMDWDYLAVTRDGKTIIYDPELAWRTAVIHIPVDLSLRP